MRTKRDNAGLLFACLLVAGSGAFLWQDYSCLNMLGCAANTETARFTVTVKLRYDGNRQFVYEGDLTRSSYNDIDLLGWKRARKYVLRARKALATRLGYREDLFSQNQNLVRCAVDLISIADDLRGVTRTVFKGARLRDVP